MKTYNDLYLGARRRLRAAGVAAHDLEARLIISHATGKAREELLALSRYYVTETATLEMVDELIRRRINGEPIAYIVGEWEFYGLPLVVNETVLIPRIDTEVLAEEAIRLMKLRGGQTRLLDLCAGCGAIGLAVAANVPDCRVVLAEASEKALAVCRTNMLNNRLSRNVTAITVDALEAPPALLGRFDAIVSNPPYIPTKELRNLDRSVRDYEPVIALDGGTDGLDFYRAIAENWSVLLKVGGYLAFECGEGQANIVRGILDDSRYGGIYTLVDTLNIERVVIGRLKKRKEPTFD
ncbi:MAG: peptide chain release factor N(5)-glutamine methyltransferase [Oscillospiraceae bacterium]|nr:peptide chain release factor N(5)-glutamine methyltransferase [Oscillospiraceae bacterium]